MHMPLMSDSSSYHHPNHHASPRPRGPNELRRHPESLVALTDGFDAPTTEAPTDWNTTGVDGVEGRDYDVSVSGYRNYVHEMERMLSEEADSVHSLPRRDALHRPRRQSTRGPEAGASGAYGAGRMRQNSVGGYSFGGEAHLVDGQIADVQLIEHRVEDGPARTIALWRERVAQQMNAPSEPDTNAPAPVPAPVKTKTHRKQPSNESRAGQGRASGSSSSGKGKGKSQDSGYQRTEYIISYQQPAHMGIPQHVYTPSEAAAMSPRPRRNSSLAKVDTRNAMSPAPASPRPRANSGKSFERTERTEYIINYLHTPPHSQESEKSSPKVRQTAPMSPLHAPPHVGAYIPIDDTGASRTATASPIDLILASCEPSLLHISPILTELGIFKMEHLRAIARLSEDTRERELKGPALKRGVTVMEWAILLDKILTLQSES